MEIERLGDRGLILRNLPRPAWMCAEILNRAKIPGVTEAYASYKTVGLEIDPEKFIADSLHSVLNSQWAEAEPGRHVIPVCYELGPDLGVVASALGMRPDAVAESHVRGNYVCEAVGFCPGFPYLSGLPRELFGLPRLPSPRVRVEPGSVAITGAQSGVYPIPRPGGWNLIGRTPLCLVDVDSNYFPIRAGDIVRFKRITAQEFDSLVGGRL